MNSPIDPILQSGVIRRFLAVFMMGLGIASISNAEGGVTVLATPVSIAIAADHQVDCNDPVIQDHYFSTDVNDICARADGGQSISFTITITNPGSTAVDDFYVDLAAVAGTQYAAAPELLTLGATSDGVACAPVAAIERGRFPGLRCATPLQPGGIGTIRGALRLPAWGPYCVLVEHPPQYNYVASPRLYAVGALPSGLNVTQQFAIEYSANEPFTPGASNPFTFVIHNTTGAGIYGNFNIFFSVNGKQILIQEPVHVGRFECWGFVAQSGCYGTTYIDSGAYLRVPVDIPIPSVDTVTISATNNYFSSDLVSGSTFRYHLDASITLPITTPTAPTTRTLTPAVLNSTVSVGGRDRQH